MFPIDLKSLSKSPLFMALLLVLPVDGERDVFNRVRKLRLHSYYAAYFFAVFCFLQMVVRAADSEQRTLNGTGILAWGIFGLAWIVYAHYQNASMSRLDRENKYLPRDIYEIFWPLLGTAAIGIVAPLLVVGAVLIGLFNHQFDIGLVFGTILLCIPILCVHLFLAEKVRVVYRSSLEAIGGK